MLESRDVRTAADYLIAFEAGVDDSAPVSEVQEAELGAWLTAAGILANLSSPKDTRNFKKGGRRRG